MKSFENFNLKNKNIILRVDLNVPIKDGGVKDKTRIESIKPTLKKLINNKNKIFLLSHFGRPGGIKDLEYSLSFICSILKKEFLLEKIYFLDNFEEINIQQIIEKMNFGEVCLFENIRFFTEEENNDLNFAKKISQNFDAFINDAFSASHRQHASIVGITNFLPSFAGLNMLNEIKSINSFIEKTKKPKLAIIGGSKISTKIDVLNNLSELCDSIVIGGAMANTFLYAQNINIGKSLYEKKLSSVVFSIMENAKNNNCEIILPEDVVCANDLNDKINIRVCDIEDIYPNQMILDVGHKTSQKICQNILKSSMVLWNGPLGAFETKPFDKSSIEIAKTINKNAKLLNIDTIAGGGDTVAAIKLAKAEEGFVYISKAGGAFLEWLEGKESPGVIALRQNKIN